MKSQKGFIQMPFLFAIIAGVLVLSGGGYFGVKSYQKYKIEQIEQKRIDDKKAQENQVAAEAQQKALVTAQQEIEKLKTESELLKKPSKFIKKESEQVTSSSIISAEEINPFLSGVVQVICKGSVGSGSLWKQTDSSVYMLLTNKHVIETPFTNGYCFISVVTTDDKASGVYLVNTQNLQSRNYRADVAILELVPFTDALFFIKDMFVLEKKLLDISVPIDSLNYKISTLPKCATNTSIASNIMVVGYPAFTSRTAQEDIGVESTSNSRTVSNGIISATDSSPLKFNLPYSDYYISAKIDSGNSGGMAFSKSDGKLCVLGIPTWLTIGNYETQGIVQNIHNVFYKE